MRKRLTWGDRLKKLRKKLGHTSHDMAPLLEITPKAYYRLESNQVRPRSRNQRAILTLEEKHK